MRFKVSLKKNGKEFDEVVIANNKKEAMKVALKNNPEAQANNTNRWARRQIKDYREYKAQK